MTPSLLERIGVELPVVQAGMGGGVARHELAAAVSAAGGLGTIGTIAPDALRKELAAARRLTDRPVAVNLLLPFARRAHYQAAADADLVVTFWGIPRRRVPGLWVHQCGSVHEAMVAHAAGADGAIAQGVEAGGHVRGNLPTIELVRRMRRRLPPSFAVLAAGGMANAADVREALDAGAGATVLGTRFLMTEESRAHPAYKQRCMEARETVLTELFGSGWAAAPHRVLWNEATERWLGSDRRGPAWVRAANALAGRLTARAPDALQRRAIAVQRPGVPILTPAPPTDDGPSNLVDAGALYAGESVARLHDVRPAGEVVRELAG